jgi:cell division protein FtsL
MSEPARRLQRPAPVVAPSRPAARPRPSRSLPVPGPAMPRPSARVRRRRGTIGFLVLSTAVVGSMILGVVALNALLAQSSFRVDDLQQRIAALSQEHLELVHEQATLSAPGRIAAWARRHGMRLPDDIRFLHVPPARRSIPAGVAATVNEVQRNGSGSMAGGE